jgi:hypothetical protein
LGPIYRRFLEMVASLPLWYAAKHDPPRSHQGPTTPMHEIRIWLGSAASLAPLAAPVVGAGALPPGMPGAPGGIYLIVNTATNTRYAGISTNIQTRFNGRMAVINELGLNAGNMGVVWA